MNSNSSTNHTLPARQRHVKRGSGGNNRGGHSQSGFGHPPQPPAPPPFPVFSIHSNGYHNLMPAVPDPSHREFPYRSSNWETRPAGGFVSQSHPVNDHRSPSRRGNSGPHQRGDGHYHNNHHGGRRDQERGNYANVRDVHMQPQRAPLRGFVRTPPNTTAFVTPQPVRPFVNHMGFHGEFIFFCFKNLHVMSLFSFDNICFYYEYMGLMSLFFFRALLYAYPSGLLSAIHSSSIISCIISPCCRTSECFDSQADRVLFQVLYVSSQPDKHCQSFSIDDWFTICIYIDLSSLASFEINNSCNRGLFVTAMLIW